MRWRKYVSGSFITILHSCKLSNWHMTAFRCDGWMDSCSLFGVIGWMEWCVANGGRINFVLICASTHVRLLICLF
ncbi:hypothetical protein V6Z11_A10G198600 [Gossypium hirsutum]